MTRTAPAITPVTAVNRLTADDDLFLKLHSLYGNALVNQLAWRFDEPLGRDLLDRFHAQLAHGFLARRVQPVRVPFARPYWLPATASIPLGWDTVPVADDEVLDWFFAQSRVDFDPASGLVWRLSAAPTTAGGTVVSLVTSHVASDGGAVLFAVNDALARVGATPDRATSSGALVGRAPRNTFGANAFDAILQLRAVATGIGAAIAARGVTEPARTSRPATPLLPLPDRWSPADVVVNLSLDQWNSVAATHSGTTNGLLIALGAGLLGRSGRVGDAADIRVDIPHSLRTADDPRANATTGLPISVRYRATDRVDLGAIRTAIRRAATAYRDPATTPALQHLQPVQRVLPRAVLRHFARTATAPECLCTNLGETAEGVAGIGGHRAAEVLMRPVVATNDPALFRRMQAGVNLSFCTDGHTVTLAVTGADPDRFPTRAALRALLTAEFASWGLTPHYW
ncbi:hypothetical protein NN3_39100 [Nocardia neocaledoniensis NBRC 108232]|uniref:Diacylglycerol O-acyltransferase n=1 Tax=Nocardia neocaledoniensis TaxID=236511 RepID=A0A317NG04_9NOCA|nr:hypothetical protein [Nocardia neocaledoniensis]PWV74316.1 hypothetical protein DFR69_106127 [Nocardia neocaledoniensis]GEM32903.1 hypothetical protein NN3_39100 [Nocardia neocaledoniensis NBRC 108232]